MNFDWDKIMKFNTVVLCDTEEKSRELLAWADSRGLKWTEGETYLELSYYTRYLNEICYYLYNGQCNASIWFKDKGFEILNYEDVLLSQAY